MTASTSDSATQPKAAVPIVAIGASAGGIEAVTELLQHLPSTTGFAFVYVQPVSSDRDSRLADILGRLTNMPVLEAEHLMRVEPNQVYVIPPGQDLEVIDGVMMTVPRPQSPGLHMPIDVFFSSLADRQKDGAVAVVLSGTDGDGTQGLRAIKAAGGITFAQDETARFQSMPKSAIAEGVVDQVLPPADIARELERLSRRIDWFSQTAGSDKTDDNTAPPLSPSDENIRLIIAHLRRVVGVDFTHYKITTIHRRIVRRMMLFKLDTLAQYVEYLRQHADEVKALYADLLINVTTFFRDVDTMDYLRKMLLPQLLREKPPREPLRIWVPACSTGQEAYSIAMLLIEVMNELQISTSIQIFATDLSEQAISKARLGSYSKSEVADVSPGRLQQFFTRVEDQYRINRNIRDLCVFAPHNLFRDPPFSRLHLVSCRNLLIYLDNVLQRKALSTFHYALNPGGYLLLGKSETVGNSASLFTPTEKNYKAYVRKNDVASPALFELQPVPARPPVAAPPAPPPPPRAVDLDQTVDQMLLSHYVPASVVVNADLDILQFRGATSLFLHPAPGKASLNLLRMAHPSLTFELRSVVHKAGRQGQAVRREGLEMRVGDKAHVVAISAAPLPTGADERLFLVTFQEVMPAAPAQRGSAKARSQRIRQLEEELANARRDMHDIIEQQEASNEELQSANEEIVSSNEELQSINEELETGKEEIESTNEELLTINQELQIRNDQLTEAYEYAEAIVSTIGEATLILNGDLRVRSASTRFYHLFRVTEAETAGRLIYELGNRQWDIPQLRTLLEDVIPHDKHVQGFIVNHAFPAIGEKLLSLNARRVVRQGNQEAILLAIEDLTEQHRARQLLAEREAWFRNIADNAAALTWVAGDDGRYTFFNRAWLSYTGRSLDDELLRGWALDVHSDDRDMYQQLYQRHLGDRQPFDTEYRLRRHDGEYRWMLENARPTFNAAGAFTGYIGSAVDIHLQKTLNQELDRRVRERTQDLSKSLVLLQQTEDLARIGSWEFNRTDDRFLWSEGMYRLLDREPGSPVMPELYLDMATDADRPVARRLIEYIRQGSGAFDELMQIEVGGQTRTIHIKANVTADEGQPVRALGIDMDITDEVAAREQIRESAEMLRSILDGAQAGIVQLRAVRDDRGTITDFIILTANRLATVLNERPAEETIGHRCSELFPHYKRIGLFDRYRSVVETGEAQRFENPNYGPGSVRWFDVSLVKLNDGLILTYSDISTRKQAEEQVRQTARDLQVVLDSSPASIAYLGAMRDEAGAVTDFCLRVCNQRFADLVGKPIGQLVNQLASRLREVLWDENTVELLSDVLSRGEPAYQERSVPGPGGPHWTGLAITRQADGVVLTGLDITALKEAEGQRETLLSQLAGSEQTLRDLEQIRQQLRERGELLRQTSHDLRGSFGVIQGVAQLLDLSDSDDERAHMMEMLQRNIREISQMMTQLLDYSRLEAGQEAVEQTPFDAAALLHDLIGSLRTMADERQLSLRAEGDAPLPVVGDAVKVRRIAQNLVLNALKYSEVGGVTVRWCTTTDGWLLTVDDTGPGLPPALLRRLTDANGSADGAADQLPPGTSGPNAHSPGGGEGIGLLIVKRLVALLRARLSVTSEPNVGTRFEVRF